MIPASGRRPEADVILYDGHCALCQTAVRRLARWDSRKRLQFLPLDAAEVVRRWPQLDREELRTRIHLITPDGRVLRGAEVARRLSRKLPRLWALAPLLHLPGTLPLWQALYRLIARGRYFFGRSM